MFWIKKLIINQRDFKDDGRFILRDITGLASKFGLAWVLRWKLRHLYTSPLARRKSIKKLIGWLIITKIVIPKIQSVLSIRSNAKKWLLFLYEQVLRSKWWRSNWAKLVRHFSISELRLSEISSRKLRKKVLSSE